MESYYQSWNLSRRLVLVLFINALVIFFFKKKKSSKTANLS